MQCSLSKASYVREDSAYNQSQDDLGEKDLPSIAMVSNHVDDVA